MPQEKAIPHIDLDIFQDKAGRILIRLNNAFVDLREMEPKISKIALEEEKELAVTIDELGEYRFLASGEEKVMYMSSPIQGVFKYYYSQETSMWTSNKDGHFLEENLTRELSGVTRGYLDL